MQYALLIANYNNGRYIEDCINSILAQTYTQWQAVIIDDASTDDSVQQIRTLIKDDARFQLHVNDINRGVGYSKHRCITVANSPWCGFIDPDDALTPDALEVMEANRKQHEDAVLLHAGLYFCDEQLNRLGVYRHSAAVNANDKMFFNLDGAVSAFAVFNKAAYIKTGGIDTYMPRAVDQDMYIKLAEQGAFHFVDERLYLYRRNPSGISTNDNVSKAHYWHWYAAIQAARRLGVELEDEFTKSFVPKKAYDQLKEVIDKSGVYKLSKILAPVLKYKSGK